MDGDHPFVPHELGAHPPGQRRQRVFAVDPYEQQRRNALNNEGRYNNHTSTEARRAVADPAGLEQENQRRQMQQEQDRRERENQRRQMRAEREQRDLESQLDYNRTRDSSTVTAATIGGMVGFGIASSMGLEGTGGLVMEAAGAISGALFHRHMSSAEANQVYERTRPNRPPTVEEINARQDQLRYEHRLRIGEIARGFEVRVPDQNSNRWNSYWWDRGGFDAMVAERGYSPREVHLFRDVLQGGTNEQVNTEDRYTPEYRRIARHMLIKWHHLPEALYAVQLH